ncbi:helix-turn-helix domain-containing protein [Streptomyces sp. PSKA01]|uniref:Helix-turn-helix domain-containing protein n=1 Tax=Streptomyces cupreus TaxID=2759956 RepID=A0A7X1J7Z1_9ACTN|nr:helix-turn-helix domain-containing protein [Streptomyces cupreus]
MNGAKVADAEGHRDVPARYRTPGEPVLERAFRLLACFGPGTGELSLTALAGLPKATTLRLARQLVALGAQTR